ncbi:hypothetical protein Ddc_10121 [Ditylenchus destructor]|nr:hypothetical protein Ddc_10121 [Ditylenchus destructor]
MLASFCKNKIRTKPAPDQPAIYFARPHNIHFQRTKDRIRRAGSGAKVQKVKNCYLKKFGIPLCPLPRKHQTGPPTHPDPNISQIHLQKNQRPHWRGDGGELRGVVFERDQIVGRFHDENTGANPTRSKAGCCPSQPRWKGLKSAVC